MTTKRTSASMRAALQTLVFRGIPVALGLGVLFLIIAWVAGAFDSKIEPHRVDRPPQEVAHLTTETVADVEKPHIEEAMGTVRAASRTVVSSRLLAVIVEVAVAAGDNVESGKVLVRLQDADLRARLQQSEQALLAATANRVDAERNVARNENLYKTRAVAKSVLDDSRRRFDVTSAEEQRAEQAVEEARIMQSYAVITAPKPGRVVDRLAQPGDTVRPGDPILVLYDETSLRLEAAVPERLVAQLKVGDKLDVYIDAHLKTYKATVDEIVPQSDAPSRSFLVKVALPPVEGLFEGMFGRLLLPLGNRRHLCLATDAILRMGQLEFVEVVDGSEVERRMVQTGRLGKETGRVEVLSGLRVGEKVVLHGTAFEEKEVVEEKETE